MRLSRALLWVTLLTLPGVMAAQDTTPTAPKIRRNPDLITLQEIEAAHEGMRTAADLVKNLRSNWLSFRGPTSVNSTTPSAQVYVDGVHRGGAPALAEVPRGSIREIRHLRGTDATQRFGLNHENGAILVLTK